MLTTASKTRAEQEERMRWLIWGGSEIDLTSALRKLLTLSISHCLRNVEGFWSSVSKEILNVYWEKKID
ncbi:hypothetical protein CEXT_443861 [Caerostris extrusa]|uniref:Uncharacterized protein n=1 Tax=Caerostris extrusa TaxID=172846 RepID=A0AAV4N6D1_CAEEX|nr:hypothetical protein CEXT_443861 [Caerostris extrusa]